MIPKRDKNRVASMPFSQHLRLCNEGRENGFAAHRMSLLRVFWAEKFPFKTLLQNFSLTDFATEISLDLANVFLSSNNPRQVRLSRSASGMTRHNP